MYLPEVTLQKHDGSAISNTCSVPLQELHNASHNFSFSSSFSSSRLELWPFICLRSSSRRESLLFTPPSYASLISFTFSWSPNSSLLVASIFSLLGLVLFSTLTGSESLCTLAPLSSVSILFELNGIGLLDSSMFSSSISLTIGLHRPESYKYKMELNYCD